MMNSTSLLISTWGEHSPPRMDQRTAAPRIWRSRGHGALFILSLIPQGGRCGQVPKEKSSHDGTPIPSFREGHDLGQSSHIVLEWGGPNVHDCCTTINNYSQCLCITVIGTKLLDYNLLENRMAAWWLSVGFGNLESLESPPRPTVTCVLRLRDKWSFTNSTFMLTESFRSLSHKGLHSPEGSNSELKKQHVYGSFSLWFVDLTVPCFLAAP